jgi:hypothetical protein
MEAQVARDPKKANMYPYIIVTGPPLRKAVTKNLSGYQQAPTEPCVDLDDN